MVIDDAHVCQLRAIWAVEIIKTLDAERLTLRDAEARTGIAAADSSRVYQVKLDRFTVDRLMCMFNQFNRKVRLTASVWKRAQSGDRMVEDSLPKLNSTDAMLEAYLRWSNQHAAVSP